MPSSEYGFNEFQQHAYELIEVFEQYFTACQDESVPVLRSISPESSFQTWNQELLHPNLRLKELFSKIIADSTHLHHPGYVGHQVATPHPLSMLSDMVAAMLNNGMAVYEMGQVSIAMERAICERIARLIGWGQNAGGIFTSGGSLANLTALLAARERYSKGKYWEEGYYQSPALAVMVSQEAHYCISRAVKIMGLGQRGLILLPVNDSFQTDIEQLETHYQAALARGQEVFAFVANAGSTATGSYDSLEAISAFCKRHSIWLHIDGAHGGAVVFSGHHRHLLNGSSQADSITIDFHKLLQCSILCTSLVFKSIQDSYHTFAQGAQYLFYEPADEWYQVGKRTFECTKTMMVLKAYTLLHQLGEASLGNTLDRQYRLALDFADYLLQTGEFQLACTPQSNIVCFRFTPKDIASEKLDELNEKIRAILVEEGRYYIVQTRINGLYFFRTALMNPHTTLAHLKELAHHITSLKHIF